eukprot:1752428-Alexandrium_andersonii.AAC.1
MCIRDRPPHLRWLANVLYAALASALQGLASGAQARRALGRRDKRQRANLIPSKRMALPATWLAELRRG